MSFNTPAKKGKSSFGPAPSTTPNVPPPTWLTQKSTTPAGNPPESSKIFGSSFANNTFGSRFARPKGGFTVPESSPPPSDEDEDAEGEEDEQMDIGELDREAKSPAKSTCMSSIGQSPRGLKRSRNGKPREQSDGEMASIARGMVKGAPAAGITEPDNFVVRTEDIISKLSEDCQQAPQRTNEATALAAAQLGRLWNQYGKSKTRSGAIGPESEDPVCEATYLASLLMQTHAPHTMRASQPPAVTRPNRSLTQHKQSASSPAVPMPQALLEWMNINHNPFPDDFTATHMYQPSPSASESFWDILLSGLLRGRFNHTISLLRDAGWENAATAQDDGSAVPGYEGRQLEYTEEVVYRCISVIETCPAVRDGNWDIKGTDWQLFRRRVRSALQDLETFAKEKDPDDTQDDLASSRNVFARSNMSLAASTMRANSRVPWTIYENLCYIYRTLLGDEVIADLVQDWLEAAVFLTVWWDGEGSDTSVKAQNLRSSRRGLNGAGTREVDVAPLSAYRRRFSESLNFALDLVEDFQVDTLDPIQVGLACIMEDDIAGVVGIIRTMSPAITTALVDMVELDGWLPLSGQAKTLGMLEQEGFSSEDLMVLSHGPAQQKSRTGELNHDDILSSYADMLAERDVFESADNDEREGWEIAVSVLGRLNDREAAQAKIADIFDQMQFDDGSRVDKVLDLCVEMGLSEQARGIAERYADSLASASDSREDADYGSALLYYARARADSKLKSTLSLLISLSLLHSTAMPTASTLDPTLQSLLSKERAALVDLARHDTEAATLLSSSLSGYATVRRFYDLRDQEYLQPSVPSIATTKLLRPLERKRAAASALLAAIESAADCIRGGLLDPAIASVVPVDGLLALLGEALPLLGGEKRIFSEAGVFVLLRVVEDLDTVSERIKQGAEELVSAGMGAYRGAEVGGGGGGKSGKMQTRSRKGQGHSSGSLSGSSWDMIASRSTLGGEGGVEEVKRAWDWRKGLDAVVGNEVRCAEVLLLLRTALAREVAKGWGGGLNW